MQDNETRGLESTVTNSHAENDPRTLRDGPSITKLRQDVDDVDALMLEVLERLEYLEAEIKRAEALSKKVERLEARLDALESEDRQPNAQVIDAESPSTDGSWGAANGAAERLEGER